LSNFTLNGLERTVNESIYPLTKSKEQRLPIKLRDNTKYRLSLTTKLVRYADDFLVITRSKHLMDKLIVPAVEEFLKIRGL